jgi:hypothetical protein
MNADRNADDEAPNGFGDFCSPPAGSRRYNIEPSFQPSDFSAEISARDADRFWRLSR